MARNQKSKKDSLITLTRKYANNHDECVKFFFKMKWPVGFYCEKLNALPEEALVLEDSEAGIDSAYQAHIPVICIPDLKNPDDLHHKRCTTPLKSLDEVIEYIEKSNG